MKIKKEETMLYLLLFFISIFLNPALRADIAPAQFDTIIAFINKTDLASATGEDYKQFMHYAEQIVDNGSIDQRRNLTTILDNNQKTIKKDVNSELNTAAEILNSDIVTPDVWQHNVMGTFLSIDANGTPEEKAKLNDFIGSHKELIIQHCKKLINSLQLNLDVKDMLKFIAVNTLLGVLPGMVLKGLSATIGNIPIDLATTQLTDLSILCALDSIIRYGLQSQPELTQATVAAGFSTAIQNFINFSGIAPTDLNILGATITTPQLASIQAATIVLVKNNLNMNAIQNIVTNLDWKDIVLGEQQMVTIEPEKTKSLIGYIQNSINVSINKPVIKTAVKNALSYAVEGALLAAALNVVGLGAYGSTTEAALVAGMTRGALESLIQHVSDRRSGRAGILERVENGIIASTIQGFLTGGPSAAMTDMIPLVTQPVLAVITQRVVEKAGGFKTFVTNLFQ